MARNNFHCYPRPTLWTAPAGKSHIKTEVRLIHPQTAKTNKKVAIVENFLALNQAGCFI